MQTNISIPFTKLILIKQLSAKNIMQKYLRGQHLIIRNIKDKTLKNSVLIIKRQVSLSNYDVNFLFRRHEEASD